MNFRSAVIPPRGLGLKAPSRMADASAVPILTWRATQWRSKLILGLLMVGFVAVIVRSFILQHLNVEQWQSRAEKRFERVREVPVARGRVLDRNGAVIASSIREELLGIVPKQFNLQSKQIDALAQIIDMPPAEIRAKISRAKNYFYLARGLNLEQAAKIRALKLRGVELEAEYRRHYPYGDAFAHAVGFTDSEERGAEGLERTFDSQLRATLGVEKVYVTRNNDAVGGKSVVTATPGRDLQLSLDVGIQSIVQTALKTAVAEHRPKAASAIVIDVRTGEVLALSNEPSFDPNHRTRLNPDVVRNRVVTDSFEPGSTLKPFSIATALELGRVSAQTEIQTAPGKITIGNRTIGDTNSYGLLTVEQILQKSSNVGTVKISQQLQPHELHDFYASVGFGKAPDVGFSAATAGRLRDASRWLAIEQATMSYGHGISVSLIQLARAYTVFARDGDLVPLTFVRQSQPAQGTRVMSAGTAQQVRKMLEMAAGPGGTAPKAQIAGFKVAGKTGTAHKAEKGGYSKTKFIASFVGFVPADKPRFVIAVMVDEPSAGRHYGGEVAAPIFAQIASDSLRKFQISPNPALRVLPAGVLIEEGTL